LSKKVANRGLNNKKGIAERNHEGGETTPLTGKLGEVTMAEATTIL